MKNSTSTSPDLGRRLLSEILWELSLLGHKTLDLFRMMLKPGGWFRRLPHVRILLVLSMVILIFNNDISFSIHLGETDAPTSAVKQTPTTANAGFFSAPVRQLEKAFSSSAFAKTALTHMDSQTGSALIKRFRSVAEAEQDKLGIDAGVLLATAVAAGVVTTPNQVEDQTFVTNYFGSALKGNYPTAWSSWRAMSLATLAAVSDIDEPTRDDFVRAAAVQFKNNSQAAQDRIYEALRFYQL